MARLFPKRTVRELEQGGCILSVQDGNHGEKHPTSRDYVPQGVPFLMASNVGHGKVDIVRCKFITRSLADSLRIGFAQPGDVLLTHKGSIGNVGIVPNGFDYVMLTPQVTYYRLDTSKLDNTFLAFAFRHPLFLDEMALVSAQSTRPYIGITAQRQLAIYHPPLPTQRKIASILSAYDDLIENNTRRITILEEMAQAIYREWFVHFRFPGHESVGLVDSPLGMIPKGWSTFSLDEACEFIIDSEHKTAPTQAEGFPSIRTPNIGKGYLLLDAALRVSLETYNQWTRRAVPRPGDLILAREAPVGNVGIVPPNEHVCLGQRTVLIRANPTMIHTNYLLRVLLSDYCQNSFSGASSGATVAHLNLRDLRGLQISFAPRHVQDATAPTFENIDRQIANLFKRNRNLRTTRDLLLPKLISGQLDVDDLDIDVADPSP